MFLILLSGLQEIQKNYPILNKLFNKFVKILFPHTLNQKLPLEIYGHIISFMDNRDDISSLSFVESSACHAYFKFGRKQIKRLDYQKVSEEKLEYYRNIDLYLNMERVMYAILDPLLYCGCSYAIYVLSLTFLNDSIVRNLIHVLNFNSMMCYVWECKERKKFNSLVSDVSQFDCTKESWLNVLHSRQLYEIFKSIIPRWMAELAQKYSPSNPSCYRKAQVAEFILWILAYLANPFGWKSISYCFGGYSSGNENLSTGNAPPMNLVDINFPIMYFVVFVCKIRRLDSMVLPSFILASFIYSLYQMHF